MDMMAEALGYDPLEFREMNVLQDGDTFATGETLHDMHYRGLLLRDAESAIGWQPSDARWMRSGSGIAGAMNRAPTHNHPEATAASAHPEPVEGGPPSSPLPSGVSGASPPSGGVEEGSSTTNHREGQGQGTRRRGKAITCVIKSSVTPSTSSASCKLNDDGSLNVLTSSVEMGQGAKTVLAQLASEAAALPLDAVTISEPDTDSTPYDQITSSSRTTFSMGTAVTMAVGDAMRQLKELAADQLEISPDDLECIEGHVRVRGGHQSLAYADVMRKSRKGNLLGHGTFVTTGGLNAETGQGIGSTHWHHAAAACEVEVDTETGKVDILRFHSSCFAGRVVNPRLCELQIEGSTMFGLGQSLFEEMTYDAGQLTNPNLSDYMIPSFKDVPGRLTVSAVEHPGAGEIHGIGETSVPPVMPCVANAVYNAVGVRITDLPITPEKVLRALRAQEKL